jgi:hypothetical protein
VNAKLILGSWQSSVVLARASSHQQKKNGQLLRQRITARFWEEMNCVVCRGEATMTAYAPQEKVSQVHKTCQEKISS